MKLEDLFHIRTQLHDFASIIHCVPASRVRERLPHRLELETLVVNGEECAFLSVGLFRNESFSWSALNSLSWNFEQCTYGILVRYEKRPSIYYFSTLLESSLPSWAERVAVRSARLARFETNREFDPELGYADYNVRITNDLAHTRAHLRAQNQPSPIAPFVDARAMVRHFTERNDQLFEFPGPYLWTQALHREPISSVSEKSEAKVWSGELLYGSFGLWERMGFLSHDEGMKPFCVIVQPKIELVCDFPRPARRQKEAGALEPEPA